MYYELLLLISNNIFYIVNKKNIYECFKYLLYIFIYESKIQVSLLNLGRKKAQTIVLNWFIIYYT